MLFKQKIVLCNIFIVEIGNANIEQNIQQERKIEQGKVHPVTFVANHILHSAVDSKNPKRFN
jgi:hypothetical protein